MNIMRLIGVVAIICGVGVILLGVFRWLIYISQIKKLPVKTRATVTHINRCNINAKRKWRIQYRYYIGCCEHQGECCVGGAHPNCIEGQELQLRLRQGGNDEAKMLITGTEMSTSILTVLAGFAIIAFSAGVLLLMYLLGRLV